LFRAKHNTVLVEASVPCKEIKLLHYFWKILTERVEPVLCAVWWFAKVDPITVCKSGSWAWTDDFIALGKPVVRKICFHKRFNSWRFCKL